MGARSRRGPARTRLATLAALLLALAYAAADLGLWPPVSGEGAAALEALYRERRSGEMVEVSGEVRKLLSDDLRGSRHQRFILAVASDRTVLVSHNIDLAPRIAALRAGDRVQVRGQYEWNAQGGVLHWTHHDPAGRRAGGFIEHAGRTYR